MTFETHSAPADQPRRRWLKPVLYAVAALLVFGIGAAVGGGDAEAAPAPTITVTAEPEVITKTETKTVTEVPQACLDALDSADDLRQISIDVNELYVDHLADDQQLFGQFADGDLTNVNWYMDGQQDFITEIEGLTERVTENAYPTESEECRSAS